MSTPEKDKSKKLRVVHLTSVHSRNDTRVFHKQCRSVAAAGYEVVLIVADGLGNCADADGVFIIDVGLPRNRLERMLLTVKNVATCGLRLNADIYHLHDPEMLTAGLWLKFKGKQVIYDSHEDVPKQIFSKTYLSPFLRKPVSFLYRLFEFFAVSRLDAVIGATPTITDKFRHIAARVSNVNNFPILNEMRPVTIWSSKKNHVCYAGGISEDRGIFSMIDALTLTKSRPRLQLAGSFENDIRIAATKLPGWDQVDALGFCNREEVGNVLAASIVGLVVLMPTPNHIESLPVKMFEYMSAGIPIIASDFPLWRKIISDAGCGLCVDPTNAIAIARAIDQLISCPELAEILGRNGREAVEKTYNWSTEERTLIGLYRDIIKEN